MAAVAAHGAGNWDLSVSHLKKLRAWENRTLRRIFDRRWGSSLQEYRSESSEYFNRVRRGMGQGRQHIIHRTIDIYLKDIYRTQHLKDEEGKRPVRQIRDHKNRVWWEGIKKDPQHVRAKQGQLKTCGHPTSRHTGFQHKPLCIYEE